MSRQVVVAAATNVGLIRERNEDAFVAGDLDLASAWSDAAEHQASGPRGPLLTVCDGMGGSAGGEVASSLASREIWRSMLDAQTTDSPEVFARLLRRAVRAANRRVYEEASAKPGLRGMGTTVTACGFAGDRLVVATIGDSRAYVFRAGTLVQVSRDQSVVSALISAGELSITDAELQPASAILQAVGVDADVEPSLSMVELRHRDLILLCSDGLFHCVDDEGIAIALESAETMAGRAKALIAAAREAGAPDNITVIAAEVRDPTLPETASPEDLPRFWEFDPREEGPRALTSTSHVARRLAARAGIGPDLGPPVLPATGQYTAMRPRRRRGLPPTALASARGVPSKKPAVAPWLLIGGLAAAAAAFGWWLAG